MDSVISKVLLIAATLVVIGAVVWNPINTFSSRKRRRSTETNYFYQSSALMSTN
ncbi:hypothetical protein OCD63_23975 [Bacillus paranthracis]|uniref:hypothetical protein n=1 Tax=Bacillus paranthracis TaxID=2026186 RepID=UPI0021D2A2DD|nr:hypothetical protein [Bacillus paranthracis]MCU5287990.1 hypothetical protein [Bacillus paranthracis]